MWRFSSPKFIESSIVHASSLALRAFSLALPNSSFEADARHVQGEHCPWHRLDGPFNTPQARLQFVALVGQPILQLPAFWFVRDCHLDQAISQSRAQVFPCQIHSILESQAIKDLHPCSFDIRATNKVRDLMGLMMGDLMGFLITSTRNLPRKRRHPILGDIDSRLGNSVVFAQLSDTAHADAGLLDQILDPSHGSFRQLTFSARCCRQPASISMAVEKRGTLTICRVF